MNDLFVIAIIQSSVKSKLQVNLIVTQNSKGNQYLLNIYHGSQLICIIILGINIVTPLIQVRRGGQNLNNCSHS